MFIQSSVQWAHIEQWLLLTLQPTLKGCFWLFLTIMLQHSSEPEDTCGYPQFWPALSLRLSFHLQSSHGASSTSRLKVRKLLFFTNVWLNPNAEDYQLFLNRSWLECWPISSSITELSVKKRGWSREPRRNGSPPSGEVPQIHKSLMLHNGLLTSPAHTSAPVERAGPGRLHAASAWSTSGTPSLSGPQAPGRTHEL